MKTSFGHAIFEPSCRVQRIGFLLWSQQKPSPQRSKIKSIKNVQRPHKLNVLFFFFEMLTILISLAFIAILTKTLANIDETDPCITDQDTFKVFLYALLVYTCLLVMSGLGLIHHCLPSSRCVNMTIYNTCAFYFPLSMIHTALVFNMSLLKIEYCESISDMKWIWPCQLGFLLTVPCFLSIGKLKIKKASDTVEKQRMISPLKENKQI